jgi:hypothetical protein
MPTTWSPIATTTLASGSTLITFSSIPQTYKSLVVLGALRTNDSSNNVPVNLFVNGNNTSDNYYTGGFSVTNGNTFNTINSGSSRAQNVAGDSQATEYFSPIMIEYPFYTDSTFRKTCYATVSNIQINATSNNASMSQTICWSQTSAITSITFRSDFGGNFFPGSSLTLYGLSA